MVDAYRPKLDPMLAAVAELDARALQGDAAEPELQGVRGGQQSSLDALLAGLPEPARSRSPLDFVENMDAGSASLGGVRGPGMRVRGALVFILFDEKADLAACLARLKTLGVEVRSHAGHIATARAPLAVLHRLEADKDIAYVELARHVNLRKMAEADAGVSAVAISRPGPSKPDGTGTIVGIIDVEGFDLYHPDFHPDPPGDALTRVKFLWDQMASRSREDRLGAAPAPWGYGREFCHSDLVQELKSQHRARYEYVDHAPLKASHGTAAAGVAAGRGAGNAHAAGAAPGAGIIFVNTIGSGTDPLASLTELAEAADYVFKRAGETPCSVNVSLGDDLGPHDGTSPVELFFDALLEVPGRAITIAAGNSGDDRKHAAGVVKPNERIDLKLTIPGDKESIGVAIEIWYSGEALGVRVRHKGGERPEASPATEREPCTETSPGAKPRSMDIGRTRIVVASGGVYPLNGKKRVRIQMFPARRGGTMDEGDWSLCLHDKTGSGCAWDAWIDHKYVHWKDAESTSTMASPATCRGAITVGACDASGEAMERYSGKAHEQAGVLKPELTAPGTVLAASAATTAGYVSFTGTSAAAPQVAGIVALLFEQHGAISTAEVKRHLGELAKGAEPPRPGFGFGCMRAVDAREKLSRSKGKEAEHRGDSRTDGDTAAKGSEMSKHMSKGPSGPGAGSGDALQIDPGYYVVLQGGDIVGHVLVEDISTGHTKEHWCLHASYRWPSSTYPSASLAFEYQTGTPTLAEFIAKMPTGRTYVIADCVRQ